MPTRGSYEVIIFISQNWSSVKTHVPEAHCLWSGEPTNSHQCPELISDQQTEGCEMACSLTFLGLISSSILISLIILIIIWTRVRLSVLSSCRCPCSLSGQEHTRLHTWPYTHSHTHTHTHTHTHPTHTSQCVRHSSGEMRCVFRFHYQQGKEPSLFQIWPWCVPGPSARTSPVPMSA